MLTNENPIKVSKTLLKFIREHKKKLEDKDRAMVGILASANNSKVVDGLYFIKHREEGCKWFPRLHKQDVSKAICRVVKDKNSIKGLVVIVANNQEGRRTTYFEKMICKRGWENPNFLYLSCDRYGLHYWKVDGINHTYDADKFTKASIAKVN